MRLDTINTVEKKNFGDKRRHIFRSQDRNILRVPSLHIAVGRQLSLRLSEQPVRYIRSDLQNGELNLAMSCGGYLVPTGTRNWGVAIVLASGVELMSSQCS